MATHGSPGCSPAQELTRRSPAPGARGFGGKTAADLASDRGDERLAAFIRAHTRPAETNSDRVMMP
jgi:hypothetical protein